MIFRIPFLWTRNLLHIYIFVELHEVITYLPNNICSACISLGYHTFLSSLCMHPAFLVFLCCYTQRLLYAILIRSIWTSVGGRYICSLAVGDILVIFFCVPFTSTVYTVESWPYGVVVCKFSEFIKDLSIGVSVFTLTALSADRYFAIVDPMRKLTGRRATRVTCITIVGKNTLRLQLAEKVSCIFRILWFLSFHNVAISVSIAVF